MKKIFILAGLAFSMSAIAQKIKDYTGNVGINTETPQATLQIVAKNAGNNRPDGILIPKLTSAQASAKKALTTEGTLLYIMDDVKEGEHFVGAGKGFYYYDEAQTKWVKIGSGSAAAPTSEEIFTRNIRIDDRTTVVVDQLKDGGAVKDYFIHMTGAPTALTLPKASENLGRTVCFYNPGGNGVVITPQPIGPVQSVDAGQVACFISDGTNWLNTTGY